MVLLQWIGWNKSRKEVLQLHLLLQLVLGISLLIKEIKLILQNLIISILLTHAYTGLIVSFIPSPFGEKALGSTMSYPSDISISTVLISTQP